MIFFKKLFIVLIIISILIAFIGCVPIFRKLSKMCKDTGADTSQLDEDIDELEKTWKKVKEGK